MKAIVCVKQVPDTSGKVAVNPDGTLNRASMATIINPAETRMPSSAPIAISSRSMPCAGGGPIVITTTRTRLRLL